MSHRSSQQQPNPAGTDECACPGMSKQENLAFSFFSSQNWKIENTTEDHLGWDDGFNGLYENKSWKVLDFIQFASRAKLHNNKSNSTY